MISKKYLSNYTMEKLEKRLIIMIICNKITFFTNNELKKYKLLIVIEFSELKKREKRL